MEKVSIIVLTYNQEDTIRRTLDSILGQRTSYTYCIYIGDDGSKDSTRTICEEYSTRSNVKLMQKSPNKGVVKNYFDVLKICEGEYIMGCAGDDWWHNPNKIQLQIDYMDSHPECSLCHGACLEFYPASNTTIINKGFHTDNPTENLLYSNYISAPSVCYRKKYITDEIIESFQLRKYRVEDYPLWLQLSLKGDFHMFNEPLVSYTIQRGSIFHCETYEKRMELLSSTYQIRRDFITDNNLETTYGQLINDIYNKLAAQMAILYGRQSEAISHLKKVKHIDTKWRIVKILIHNSLLFKCLHKYYSRHL